MIRLPMDFSSRFQTHDTGNAEIPVSELPGSATRDSGICPNRGTTIGDNGEKYSMALNERNYLKG